MLYKHYDGSQIGVANVYDDNATQQQGLELGSILKGRDQGPSRYGEAEFRYVKFTGGTVNRNDWVVVNLAAATASQVVVASRGQTGIAMVSHVANNFGWVMIRGVHDNANILSGVAANTALYTTAVAAQLSGTVVATQRMETAFERLITSQTGYTAWVASTYYKSGQVAVNGANVYSVIDGGAGQSASSGGPVGTTFGAIVKDGNVLWTFEGTAVGTCEINWPAVSGLG